MNATELSKFIVDRLLLVLESQTRARPEGPLKPTTGDTLDPWSAPGLNEEPSEVDKEDK